MARLLCLLGWHARAEGTKVKWIWEYPCARGCGTWLAGELSRRRR